MASSNINNNSSRDRDRDSNSREYCLRWNNHQPNLVHFFGTLLSKESFVDVTLVSSEGKKILCHKMILSSCSPYFQKVFEGNPCKHPIVILKDIDYADLQTIITFIYHGEVNISQDRISSILMTANSLQVKGLAEVPAGDLKKPILASRKRDRDIEKGDLCPVQPVQHVATPQQTASNSWSAPEEIDENSPHGDIPRKKLKKSASATATSGSTSVSTNGEPCAASASFESGVGASMSRSVDDSSNSGGLENRSEAPPRASSGPPPLQSVSHLPGKSRSLDQIHDREPVSIDSELSSGGFSENQTFDEAQMGLHRSGYELDLADVKIEAVSDDGEIEFEDDEDEDENYGHPDNLDLSELHQAYPNIPTSSLFHNPAHQFAARFKGRRGRPLIRQPRIKRLDNEPGGELFISESPRESQGHGGIDTLKLDCDSDGDGSNLNLPVLRRDKCRDENTEDSVAVPIVTVSHSSPTPPSSPIQEDIPEIFSVSSSSTSKLSKPFSSIVGTSNSGNGPSPPSGNSSLLTVPSVDQVQEVVRTSSSIGSTLSPTGAHLVKQISQPLLPSHTSVHSSTSSGGNPVIRRQHSQPNPTTIQQHQQPLYHHHHHQQHQQQQSTPTRLVPLSSPNPVKRGTFFQIFPADNNHHSSSKDDDNSSPSSTGSTIFLDSTSLIQFVPTGDGTRRITISPAFSNSSLSKEDQKMIGSSSTSASGDISPDVTLTLKEDTGSFDSSTSPGPTPDGNSQGQPPVHRAGHCPALRPGPALGCNFCWNSVDECGRILRRKTKYHCPECHINLCIVPCFQEYHEKTDKKKSRIKLGLPKPSSM